MGAGVEVAPGGGGGRERRRRQNARGYRAGHAEEEKERAIGLRVILPTSQKKHFGIDTILITLITTTIHLNETK